MTYNYYSDPDKIGSQNSQATEYFITAFDYIMQWGIEDSDSAIFYLQKAIEIDSMYAIAYASLGHMIFYEGYNGTTVDLDSIEYLAKKAIDTDPQCGDALTLLARIYVRKGEDKNALEACKKAVAVEPNHRETWLWLGLMYLPDKIDSAIYAFKKSLEVDSLFGQPHQKLGNLYLNHKYDFRNAAYHYRKMIYLFENITPRDERMIYGYYGLSKVLVHEKKWDAAIDTLNLLFEKCDNTTLLWVNRLKSMAYPILIAAYTGKASSEYKNFLALNYRRQKAYPEDINLAFDILEDYYSLSELMNNNYNLKDTLKKNLINTVQNILKNTENDEDVIKAFSYLLAISSIDKDVSTANNGFNILEERYSGKKEVLRWLYYLMAYFYMEIDDFPNAITYLKKAINHGFDNFELMQSEMTKLKDYEEFIKILESTNQ